MMTPTNIELNERIRAEKRLAALENQHAAWAEGVTEGIDPEILAAAALETAMLGLVDSCGEECAANLLEIVRGKLASGGFSGYQYLN
jgi:hypothetical protein